MINTTSEDSQTFSTPGQLILSTSFFEPFLIPPSGSGPKWAQAQENPGPRWAQGPKRAQVPSGPRAQVGLGPDLGRIFVASSVLGVFTLYFV